MEKVYIIVPVYNAKKYIKRAVSSILSQSYENIHAVLVDDGSTDGSGEICDALAKKDSRLQVIHKANGGAFAARKDGIVACGDDGYITFCDADDVLDKNAVTNMVTAMGDSDICIAKLGRVWRRFTFKAKAAAGSPAVQVFSHSEFMEKKYCSWFGITDVPVSLCAKLYKTPLLKTAVAEAPDNIKNMGEDQVLTLHAMPLAKSISSVADTVYYYRPCGGTRRYVKNLYESWRDLYLHRKALIKEKSLPEWYQTIMDIEFCNMAFSCFANYLRKSDASDQGLRDEIARICGYDEVIKAMQNPNIQIEKFPRIKLLRARDEEGIFNYVKENAKQPFIKGLIKKFVVKFA